MTNDKEQPIIENAGQDEKTGILNAKREVLSVTTMPSASSELDGPQPPKKLKSGCSGQPYLGHCDVI